MSCCSTPKHQEQTIKFVKSPVHLLDVYYICDKELDYNFSDHFTKFIKYHNYKLVNITQLKYEKYDDTNVMKRGIYNFEKYFKSLKLKSSNTLWFIYIGKEIINKNKQMNIMMISENPHYGKNEFIYHISKNKDFTNFMINLFKAKKKLMFDISFP